jgi:hypothetical protein
MRRRPSAEKLFTISPSLSSGLGLGKKICQRGRIPKPSLDVWVERAIFAGPEHPERPAREGKSRGEIKMRFMVIVKATKESEAGKMPSTELLTAMGNYNEELVKAGIMLAGDGLHPSSKGARVRFNGAKRTVIDGPFAETKELIAGFWIWQVRSLDEAIEWVKRCPNPMEGESEIEIRQIFEAEDFGEAFTPELREQEQRLMTEAEKLRKG